MIGIPFCTKVAIAELCEVSEDTMERWIKDNYGCNFSDLKKVKVAAIKLTLAQRQYQSAMEGNVVAQIWLGKQWLDQSDKSEVKSEIINKHQIEWTAEFGTPIEPREVQETSKDLIQAPPASAPVPQSSEEV